MKQTNLQTHLEMYLSLRESLGGVPAMHRRALEDFVRYLSEHCDASKVRAQTAIDWARGPDRQRGACTQYGTRFPYVSESMLSRNGDSRQKSNRKLATP